jgi:hypothetical protein
MNGLPAAQAVAEHRVDGYVVADIVTAVRAMLAWPPFDYIDELHGGAGGHGCGQDGSCQLHGSRCRSKGGTKK